MQPRADGGAVQRRSAVLSAFERHREGYGKRIVDQRLCFRCDGEDPDTRASDAYQSPDRRSYPPDRGDGGISPMRDTDTIAASQKLDIEKVRKDFPILQTMVYGHPLVYLDNAATTQKPWAVIKAIENYYTTTNSNVHRGVHYLSQRATEAYEEPRLKVANFIGARHAHEIIYTRGTTDSINMVANCFARQFLNEGDSILVSGMEHHSNIVPWQMFCEQYKARLKVIPIDDNGEMILDGLDNLLKGVKFVSVGWVSNAL